MVSNTADPQKYTAPLPDWYAKTVTVVITFLLLLLFLFLFLCPMV